MRFLAFLAGAGITALVLVAMRPIGHAMRVGEVAERPHGVEERLQPAVHGLTGGDRNDSSVPDALARRFRTELRAFAVDLENTGRVDTQRARQIAIAAVSEAYRHGIPPALVFGVMLVENPSFVSTARSDAGATGLMQIMPGVWLHELGPRYGWDLTDDRVNIRFGTHILAHYYRQSERDWRVTLLRYNGCVRGTRTPNCFEYPDWVRKTTERYARQLCAGRGFDGCVTRRLSLEFDGRSLSAD